MQKEGLRECGLGRPICNGSTWNSVGMCRRSIRQSKQLKVPHKIDNSISVRLTFAMWLDNVVSKTLKDKRKEYVDYIKVNESTSITLHSGVSVLS